MKPNKTRRQESTELPVSNAHGELFHYTSISALKGILKSNSLWATQATHLNDSSEITILWPILEEQCIAYLKRSADEYLRLYPKELEKYNALGGTKKLAERDGRMIVGTMRELMLGSGSKAGMGMTFIVSFTTHEEEYHRQNGMLSQWRGYGNEGNVAIIFDAKELKRLLNLEVKRFEYTSCLVADVIYCHEEVDIVEKFPTLFNELRQFSQKLIGGWNDCDEVLEKNLSNLSASLLPAFGRLKHQAFYEEKEYRIVAGIPDESFRSQLEKLGHRDVQMKKIHYRSGVTGSIPYIRLFEQFTEKLPISRIIVGPSRNQESNERAVYEVVRQRRRAETITIQCSNIPFVGSV